LRTETPRKKVSEKKKLNHVDLMKIKERAALIKAKIGTLKLYGRLTNIEAESIANDADIIIQEAS
jgi:hypothetical protein